MRLPVAVSSDQMEEVGLFWMAPKVTVLWGGENIYRKRECRHSHRIMS